MDRSAAYIDMCRQAEELQALWQCLHGDYYVDAQGATACWIEHIDGTGRVKDGVCLRERNGIIHLERFAWLPRLDQLIELAQIPGVSYDTITQFFFNWSKRPYAPDVENAEMPADLFHSLEQLWLGFTMLRRFGRRWDRKVWV